MISSVRLIVYIAVMATVTYLIRMLPLALFRKKLKNRYIRSFLFYVPHAVLSAMTFPAIFSATDTFISALAGCIVAVVLAFRQKGLLVVALSASAAVFFVEWLIRIAM